MCFYNDYYEWTAQVCEQNDTKSTKKMKCMECKESINIGDDIHTIHMEQYKDLTCQECYGEKSEDDEICEYCDGTGLRLSNGTYDYHRCGNCELFLHAVEHIELEEGCHINEARPSLESMLEELRNADDDAKKYFKYAAKEYPQLKTNGYLGRIANWIFGN